MNKKSHFLLEFDKHNNRVVYLDYSTNEKFEQDKIFLNTDEMLCILDGVILNQKELLSTSNHTDWEGFILDEFRKNNTSFFKQLNGSFWGIVLNKRTGELLAYGDHIGSKQFFFTSNQESLILSTNSYSLTKYLKKHASFTPSLNEEAAYFVLNYGYAIEDLTLVNEITRLIPGHYLHLKGKKEEVKEFFRLNKKPQTISDEEAIEEMDRLFRKAVTAMFEKDKAYGYRHLVSLSGGLDTRMTCFVAHELGYTEQMNITFSQTDYLDETIAKQIASDLRHEWIFKSLDNGLFLKNVDRITKLTGGNVNYFGVAHGTSLLEDLNFENFGILHSGHCGNSNVGTFGGETTLNSPVNMSDFTDCPKCSQYNIKLDYQDQEMYKHLNRCMIAGNNGALPTQQKSEAFSPFYDIDFWEHCLSIPTAQRQHHQLYKKWINTKYPKAGSYVWEASKTPVNAKGSIKLKGTHYTYQELWQKLIQKSAHRLSPNKRYGLETKKHMNPISFWFSTNPELNRFYLDYVKENLQYLDTLPELKDYVNQKFKGANPLEYSNILSLLSGAKMIYE